MRHRVCDICHGPLLGRKRQGFVSLDGRTIVCGDWKMTDGKTTRHQLIKKRQRRERD
jgi:hypothetical protein